MWANCIWCVMELLEYSTRFFEELAANQRDNVVGFGQDNDQNPHKVGFLANNRATSS